jgi:hypothetical protein
MTNDKHVMTMDRSRRRSSRRRLQNAFLSLLALLTLSSAALAGTWEGIDVAIDGEWPGCGNGGYFPIRVRAVNRGHPRTMAFTFTSNYGALPTVSRTIELQTESLNFSLLVPCVGGESYGTVRVAVDGSNVPELAHSVSLPATRDWSTQGPSVLLIDTRDTDWSGFKSGVEAIVGASTASSGGGYSPSITAGDDHKYVPPDSLPGEWQAYTGLDLVAVDLNTLRRLESDDRTAILRWVDAGGTLLVYSAVGAEGGDAPSAVDAVLSSGESGDGAVEWSRSANRDGGFMTRDQILGKVVAVPRDPFRDFAADQWQSLLSSLGRQRWDWSDRHGFSARNPSSNFMEFLVPSVKGVPVFAFLILITLFAILIGPVNYVYLWKQKRLYLLIVTIPGIAFITSLSLFAYSAVAHGFATRSRVRSLTYVDQPSMTAVESSRVSYYSGLAPSGGLNFSRDSAVYPIWAPESEFESGSVDWTEKQHLESGWLRSRTRTQFYVTTHRNERGRLEVKPAGGLLSVSNGFEWDLEALVVGDVEGRLYFAEELAAGDAANLEPLKSGDASAIMNALTAHPLIAPAYAPVGRPGYGRYGGYYGGYSPPTVTYSSNQVERLLTPLAQSTTYESGPQRKRWYAAILRENPNLDLGVSSAREEASVHVLMGKY